MDWSWVRRWSAATWLSLVFVSLLFVSFLLFFFCVFWYYGIPVDLSAELHESREKRPQLVLFQRPELLGGDVVHPS